MPYLEKRRQLYYAVLTIPVKSRESLGKARYVKSTGTSDRRKAALIANQYVAGWKLLIEQAGGSNSSQLVKAIQWREELEKAQSQDKRDSLQLGLLAKVEELDDNKGFNKAKEFYDIATGASSPSSISYAQWKAQLALEPKTIDQMVKDVNLLINQFSTLESITPTSAMEWMDELESEGKTISSRKRIAGNCRNYWRYLQARKIVPKKSKPLSELVNVPRTKASKSTKANAAYTPQQVVDLWSASLAQTKRGKADSDQQLADLILLSAYTGTRIEEMCSLKVVDVTDGTFKIIDSKTNAGIREVPIHSKLKDTVKRLKKESKDGYLISGLTFNKYNDRSNALGKRFGRLKTKLGFSSRVYTAHSFRSTLITMLENAGVSENLAADIVGHEKPRITFGLYSGGSWVEVMREALERVRYPFDKDPKD